VLDFGLAKLTEPEASESNCTVTLQAETAADAILGTPAYMSPEQVGRRKVDTRSDIFSFGILPYEMVTGQRAFQRESIISTMAAVLCAEVLDCLASLQRGRRHQSISDTVTEMESWACSGRCSQSAGTSRRWGATSLVRAAAGRSTKSAAARARKAGLLTCSRPIGWRLERANRSAAGEYARPTS
jgi:serine/threonine protein kinase